MGFLRSRSRCSTQVDPCSLLPLPAQVPLCYSTMLGTHNSGITLADGYGTLDPYFQKYFEWIKWAVSLSFLQFLPILQRRFPTSNASCMDSGAHSSAERVREYGYVPHAGPLRVDRLAS